MLVNVIEKVIESTAYQKLKAVLSGIIAYIHKDFLWGIFKNIDIKLIKFLFVGVLNTLFSYAIYAFFVFIGIIANIALFLQYIIGVLWNFKTTGVIVFKNNNNKLLFKFVLSYIFTFILNSILLTFLTIHINPYIAQALLIFPIAVISFLILRAWVFK